MEKSIFQKNREKKQRYIFFFFFLYSAFTFFGKKKETNRNTLAFFFPFAGTILGNFYNRKNVSLSFVPAKHTFFFLLE